LNIAAEVEITMTNDVKKVSKVADFAELKKLFGPPPVLSSEDANAYYAMMARIIEAIEPRDFIEQMLAKDLTDVTWQLQRYSRHKALAVERQYREQQLEAEDEQEAEQAQDPADESKQTGDPGEEGQQVEQVEQVAQTGAPTTQFDRMLVLAEMVDAAVDD